MTKLTNFVTKRWKTKKGVIKECYYYRMPRSEGRRMIPLGSDYRNAIKRYAEIIGANPPPPKANTVEFVYQEYITWAGNRTLSKLSPRTIQDRCGYWSKLKPLFGDKHIDSLRSSWMFKYFENRSSQVSAKKELKFLSVLCNWAKARDMMQAPNPCHGIMQQLVVNESREIYVQDTWYQLVYENGCQMVKDAMEFTYLFANRPAESSAAMFRHIEDGELVIELQKTKGKGLKEKRIPLEGNRLEFVNRQKRRAPHSFYILSDEKGQRVNPNGAKFRKAWAEARDRAEQVAAEQGHSFERFQLRDLRAKAGTDIARDHGIEAARLMLGHTTQKQTAAYIRSVRGAAKMALNAVPG